MKAGQVWRFSDARSVVSKAARRVASLTRPPPPLSYSIIREETAFQALQSEWEELYRRAALQTPFLRYSWLRLCWDRQRNIDGTSLFITVVRKHGRPVLIAPFRLRARRLSFLDSLTPQYNDLLIEDSADESKYVDYLWQNLRRLRGIRGFRPKWVREDSPLLPHLDMDRLSPRVASYIDLTKSGDWHGYWNSLPAKFRRDHRRRLRNLKNRGAVAIRISNINTCVDDASWLFSQKREWLDRKGKSSTWLKAPGTEELFTAAAKEGIESGRTWLTVLSVDGTTIAAKLSFREGTTLYVSKAAYEPAWHAYSPGRTLQLHTIERAFLHGIRKCDLMIGGQGWLKDKLATGKITVWKEGLTQR